MRVVQEVPCFLRYLCPGDAEQMPIVFSANTRWFVSEEMSVLLHLYKGKTFLPARLLAQRIAPRKYLSAAAMGAEVWQCGPVRRNMLPITGIFVMGRFPVSRRTAIWKRCTFETANISRLAAPTVRAAPPKLCGNPLCVASDTLTFSSVELKTPV